MKLCRQILKTCVHKPVILDFNLFAQIGSYRHEFQTVRKIQPIDIRYLTNLQFLKENGP